MYMYMHMYLYISLSLYLYIYIYIYIYHPDKPPQTRPGDCPANHPQIMQTSFQIPTKIKPKPSQRHPKMMPK